VKGGAAASPAVADGRPDLGRPRQVLAVPARGAEQPLQHSMDGLRALDPGRPDERRDALGSIDLS
jgi:hypothetical protein